MGNEKRAKSDMIFYEEIKGRLGKYEGKVQMRLEHTVK
jgi:hypothetical protein